MGRGGRSPVGPNIGCPTASASLAQRCLLAGRAIWFYVAKVIWPANLMFVYPRWTLDPRAWQQYLFPIGGLAAAAVLLWLARKNRAPFAAFLFFTGTLVPGARLRQCLSFPLFLRR